LNVAVHFPQVAATTHGNEERWWCGMVPWPHPR